MVKTRCKVVDPCLPKCPGCYLSVPEKALLSVIVHVLSTTWLE